jgi:hypothetical protein
MTSAHASAPEGEAQGPGPARRNGKRSAAKAGTAALPPGALGVVFADTFVAASSGIALNQKH